VNLNALAGFSLVVLPLAAGDFEYSQFTNAVTPTFTSLVSLKKRVALTYLHLLDLGVAPDILLAWLPNNGGFVQQVKPAAAYVSLLNGHVILAPEQGAFTPQANSRMQAYLGALIVDDLTSRVQSRSLGVDPATIELFDPLIMYPEYSGLDPNSPYLQSGYLATWPSPSQYQKLYDRFRTVLLPLEVKPHAAGPSQYFLITGTVAADGPSGSFDPGFQTTSTVPADAGNSAGGYCLRFSGASGALEDYCFDVSSDGTFGVRAPFPAGASRVGLVVHGGASDGKELASIVSNGNTPAVQFTSPATGAQLAAGPLSLSWTASEAGGASSPILSSPAQTAEPPGT
jgi:hypothetical protein